MKATALVFALTLGLVGCGAQDAINATKSMPGKMDDTAKKMDKTECALKQGISFEAMLKDEFGRVLIPAPLDLMPFAETFAECSPDEKLPKLVYLWMKKLNEVTLDVSNPTPGQTEDFNHKKLHWYSALQAVAGFIPADKLKRIIVDQVDGEGPFQDSVMEMLMLRVQFIRDVRLENGLFTKGLVDIGRVELAMELADEIEYIARLPFASSISVAVTGFVEPYPDVKESFDSKAALAMWQKIKTRAERLNTDKDFSGKPGENAQKVARRKARMTRALNLIDQRINGWTGRP